MKVEFIFPTILMLLSFAASGVYAKHHSSKLAVYYLLAGLIYGALTYLHD